MFRPALGDENATETVSMAASKLGLYGRASFSDEQALQILSEIAQTPGLVGITARLASTRIHLRLARGSSQRAIDILKGH